MGAAASSAQADPPPTGSDRGLEPSAARAAQVRLERPFYVLPALHHQDIGARERVTADRVPVQLDLPCLTEQTRGQEEDGGRRARHRPHPRLTASGRPENAPVRLLWVVQPRPDFAFGDADSGPGTGL